MGMTAASEKVLQCWNDQKKNGRWKTHREVKPDISDAVKGNMARGWTVEDMCDSIRTFAKVLQSGNYRWKYAEWGLPQFLTRGCKEKDWRWVWFHPNNFNEFDWLTDKAKSRRVKANKDEPYKKPHVDLTDEQKRKIREDMNF